MKDFVHLHLHTEYSLLDGACRTAEVPEAAKRLGQSAVAVTDHGVMFAAVEFYDACKKCGVKPIIGCEVYVARRTRSDRVHALDAHPYHLTLLCRNAEGYRNLIKLVSLAYTEGFYSKPRVDRELLGKYSGGLIALSGCMFGEVAVKLRDGDRDGARQTALFYNDMFGSGNYYIEVQNHGTKDDLRLLNGLFALSDQTGIPIAATNDVHYITRSDAAVQRVLLAIQTNTTLDSGNDMGFPNDEFYMKSADEMYELFKGHEEACENTVRIAKQCSFDFEFGVIKLPRYDLAPEDKARYPENAGYLRELCREGLLRRYGEKPSEEAKKRLEYELSVITGMGYTDYYLIVWDFVNYAKSHEIPVGPGRGSGAGSIAAYCIGITDVDPLEYSLLFERFLNPERVSMPDFDIDFCYEGRQRVIDYVTGRYGKDRVSQIVTFGTMAAKGAVRDVARVMGLPYSVGDRVARLIPQELHITLARALEGSAELKELYSTDADVRRLIDIASSIEGMPRNMSTHAAGVVISDKPVSEYVPLVCRDDIVATQYTMTALERLGLLKMDFLGLRNLTIIRDCSDFVRRSDRNFDIEKIPLSDKGVFDMISKGDTLGVFQFESAGMRSMLTRLCPGSIEDLTAALSLYRPGPMDSIPRYIENRRHPERITYKHPLLKNILDVTYGCIVYQEQVMEICRALGGYSYGRADLVRRAMAKKKHDVMEKERSVFVEGCMKNDIPKETADSIFDEMAGFASYAFNKSHAAAYSIVAYRTAYLKYHYFNEYMAALMTANEGGSLAEYINECRKKGVRILRPDVNESMLGFTPVADGIRFSLLAAKNVGRGLVGALISERTANGRFTSVRDFFKRMSGSELNRRAAESLIKCGALDGMGLNRRQMLMHFDQLFESPEGYGHSVLEGQLDLFGSDSVSYEEKIKDETEFELSEMLRMEKEILGMYVSGHPLDEFAVIAQALRMPGISQIKGMPDGTKVRFIAMIDSVRKHTTGKGSQMAFTVIGDISGTIEMTVFPSVYIQNSRLFAEESIIAAEGRISYRDGKPGIIAEGVVPAEFIEKNMRSDQGRYELFICCRSTDRDILTKTADICAHHAGESRVIFYLSDTKQRIVNKRARGAVIDRELLKALTAAAGAENVIVRERERR